MGPWQKLTYGDGEGHAPMPPSGYAPVRSLYATPRRRLYQPSGRLVASRYMYIPLPTLETYILQWSLRGTGVPTATSQRHGVVKLQKCARLAETTGRDANMQSPIAVLCTAWRQCINMSGNRPRYLLAAWLRRRDAISQRWYIELWNIHTIMWRNPQMTARWLKTSDLFARTGL